MEGLGSHITTNPTLFLELNAIAYSTVYWNHLNIGGICVVRGFLSYVIKNEETACVDNDAAANRQYLLGMEEQQNSHLHLQ